MSQRAPEQRHSGSGDVARRGSAADLPHTIQSLQTLACCRCRPPPPARPPVSSQTTQSEMSHRQERASPGTLGCSEAGSADVTWEPALLPAPTPPVPASELPPSNQSQLVCAKPGHPLPPSLRPYRSPRHVGGGGACSHERQLLCLDEPNKRPPLLPRQRV